jgi:protein involved in polysaccharide export with SLBB domain
MEEMSVLSETPKLKPMGRAKVVCWLTVFIAWSVTSSGQLQQTPQDDGGTTSARTNSFGGQQGSGDLSPELSQSAKEILDILDSKPELVVDIKKIMANELELEGFQIQDDAITDEMLYGRIISDVTLRRAITNWLRARGYLGDRESRQSDGSNNGGAESEALTPSSRTATNSNSDQLPPSQPRSQSPNAGDDTLDGSRSMLEYRSALDGIDRGMSESPGELKSLGDSRSTQITTFPDLQKQREASVTERRDNQTRLEGKQPLRDQPELLHQPAPYNLHSLRDLYTQIPEQGGTLKRFGTDVFMTRTTASKEMPIDLPVGPDYVVGTGDSLAISMWGSISQNFNRTIDREGKITLPEAGTIVVAGQTLEKAEETTRNALTQQFKDVKVSVTVTRLRSIRVYVVGDVQRPGAYDISSLSTPLNALYAAGGPTSVGSLRKLRHYRGKELIREVDLYEFLLHGIMNTVERLEPGDTILVPPVGPQVAISGMVKRPGIYELKGESKLSEILEDAGGTNVSAALSLIKIERVEANDRRETVSLSLPAGSAVEAARKALDSFMVKDGDRVDVAPILPYSERAIYVEGHVVRPGKVSYRDNLMLSDVIRSYQDLLPEPADHGEIVRLMPPDLRPETITFDLPAVMIGSTPIPLQPFDTIRIRGRYEADAPKVTIRGEVVRPGSYALSEGMTAAKLVRMAGGFKRSALLDDADLASYMVQDGRQVVSQRMVVKIGAAVNNNDSRSDIPLKPGDILTVHQVSGWNDIGASVKLEGEVVYPGTYGLQDGEKLSSVLRRAGGFKSTAYPHGAVLVRLQVRELEERSRAELIRQIETSSVGAKLAPNANGQDETGTLQLLVQQQNQVLQRLRSQPASGRLVIKISSDISSWENTAVDIEMRRGDILTIPKQPGFVLVSGQVYNALAQTYVPNKTAGWYLQHAGGTTDLANRKEIFVVRANGSVVGRRSASWYDNDVLSVHLDPGDTVVVPQKFIGGSTFWRNMLTTAQIASSIALTVAVALGI